MICAHSGICTAGMLGLLPYTRNWSGVKRALAMMWFAYVNSDKEDPHNYETEALEEAERLLGPWKSVCRSI